MGVVRGAPIRYVGRVTDSSQTLTEVSCERHSVGQRPKTTVVQSNNCNEYFLFNIITSKSMSARITVRGMAAASIGHRTVLRSYLEIVRFKIRVQNLLALGGSALQLMLRLGYVQEISFRGSCRGMGYSGRPSVRSLAPWYAAEVTEQSIPQEIMHKYNRQLIKD